MSMTALHSIAGLPPDAEAARQAALERYAVLDTSPEPEFDDIVRLAVALCDMPVATVGLFDRDRLWFKARIGIEQAQLPRVQSVSERLLARPQLLAISDLMADSRGSALPLRSDGRALRSLAAAPLLAPHGHVIGVVCVADTQSRTLTARQREGLEVLARHTVQLLDLRLYAIRQNRLLLERERMARRAERARAELQDRHEQLIDIARRDGLTGLYNRAALAQLREDPELVQRFAHGISSVLLLDVDHFKQVNDRHGHLLGDRALRVVADAITASIRETDVAVRFGGEEFLVALPQTDLAHAAEVAHRIRAHITDAALPFALTVSVGIAAGDAALDLPEQVFDRADQALYRAKAAGRDRVVVDDTPRF